MSTRFYNSLNFRIPALFVVLLASIFFSYQHWIDSTLYLSEWADGEEDWYAFERLDEAAALADRLSPVMGDAAAVDEIVFAYLDDKQDYDLELAVFDTGGRQLVYTGIASLIPPEPALLDSMCRDDWDFDIFPDETNLDAYVNRIFHVQAIGVGLPGDGAELPTGWLVSTYGPVTLEMAKTADREQVLRGAAAILLFACISGLILMTWLSRRIGSISTAMGSFRDGAFESRAPARSPDELGRLGRDFNTMADEITAMIARLEQAERYRKQLVANISHDLRTPIASLRGYLETLDLRGAEMSDADRAGHMKSMNANLVNLEQLIGRLFELTRLESDQYEFRREVFYLEEMAAELIDRTRVQAADRELNVRFEADEDLPPVDADPVQIGQVIQNLLDNAVKFNRPGGHVSLSLTHDGDRVRVQVTDNGVGIDPDDLPHVFERFYTADKSRQTHSTGLGLAIAHRIVKGHGSELAVVSGRGTGTAFSFTLPVGAVD